MAKVRIDAEGFGKTEARLLAMLSRIRCNELMTVAEVSDGNHLSIADDFSLTSGVRYLRGQDISPDMMLDDRNAVFIPLSEYNKLRRSHIYKNDVLITIVGANTGQTALVYEAPNKLTANCKLGILRVREEDKIPPPYLHAFLASRFGQFQIQQSKRGAGQTGLILPDLKALRIPRFRPQLEQAIAATSQCAHRLKLDSKAILENAEQTLLRALGLEGWQSPEPLTYTHRASAAFAAGRLDADYFAPKYDAMFAAMKIMGECVPLASLLKINRRGKQPQYAENGLPVINSKHVLKNEVRLDADNAFAVSSDDALTIKNGDVLINGTGVGTIGRAAAYLHDTLALPDNHVTILRPRPGVIDPIYLSVYLNTIAGQWQVEKYLRGSSGQIELYPIDIAQFQICLVPELVQREIHSLVLNAFSARRKAHALLEAAKRAVEIAIEDSEAAAMAYLKKMETT